MTAADHIAKLKKKALELASGEAIQLAATTVHGEMVVRIFEDGERAQGGKIGNYNTTKPLYINPLYSPKSFPKKGKTGKTVFKNKKPHKTGYFQSYSQFRNKIGRQIAFIDFNLSGRMYSDFRTSLTFANGTFIAGFNHNFNTKKYRGLTKKFGSNIFMFSKREREMFINIARAEFIKRLNA